MTPQKTFYASQVIGCRIIDQNGNNIGKVKDIIVSAAQPGFQTCNNRT